MDYVFQMRFVELNQMLATNGPPIKWSEWSTENVFGGAATFQIISFHLSHFWPKQVLLDSRI